MNITTVFGVLFGTTLLVLAIAIGVSEYELWRIEQAWGIFVNLPGLFIVLGGTIAATFISYPAAMIRRVFHSLAVVFRQEVGSPQRYIREITRLAAKARSGTLILQKELPSLANPFLRDGIQMLVDDFTPEEITEILHQRVEFRIRKELQEAHVFRTIAKLSPAFGMIGTLIGLIGMLANMDMTDTLGRLGGDMAVALVTTFYGLILANLFFIPFANKLENRTSEATETMRMIEESILMIAEKWHHRKVEDYLNSFVTPADRLRTKLTPLEKPTRGDENDDS